jgi:hypothetical protein
MWLALLIALFFPPRIEEKPLNYFLENRTERCWVLDRSSNKQVTSVAASGFGMASWAIAAQEGRITRIQALEWINRCLDETMAVNGENHGWLYHFTDLSGKPTYYKGVSSIDSALFYLGARSAAYRLGDKDLIAKVEGLIACVDRDFMLSKGGTRSDKSYFCHGFFWEEGKPKFMAYDWGDEYSEGVLLYRLFNMSYAPKRVSETLPLFVYYYPLCFYREQPMIDLLGRVIDRQVQEHGIVGFTACDGPGGYGVMQADVISPLAVASCEPFHADKVKTVWERVAVSKTTPALQLKTGWVSEDRIGIDDGAYVLTHYPVQRR